MKKEYIFIPLIVLSVLIVYNTINSVTAPVVSSAMLNPDAIATDIMDNIRIDLAGVEPVQANAKAIGYDPMNAGEVAVTSNPSQINTDLYKSHVQYLAEIVENQPDAFEVGTYRVELFEDGKSKGVLYVDVPAPDPTIIEGFTAVWDLGIDLPGNAVYKVKVTKCPCES